MSGRKEKRRQTEDLRRKDEVAPGQVLRTGFYVGNQQAYDAKLFAIMRGMALRHTAGEKLHHPRRFTGGHADDPARCSGTSTRYGCRHNRARRHAIRTREHPYGEVGSWTQKGIPGNEAADTYAREAAERRIQPPVDRRDKRLLPREARIRMGSMPMEGGHSRVESGEKTSDPDLSQRLGRPSRQRPRPLQSASASYRPAMQ